MTTAALIYAGIAAAAATAGAAGSASNRAKARREEAANYQAAQDFLRSQYYRDPLSTVGNRSLLKTARENYEDNLEALNNRMIAGGATMENQLAARKSVNEGMDRLYGQLLQGEDARRDRLSAQRLQLDAQHSQNIQNGYMQAAQDWQQWGGQMANAALSYGSSSLLGGAGAGASRLGGAYAIGGAGDPNGALATIASPGVNDPNLGLLPNGQTSIVPGGLKR